MITPRFYVAKHDLQAGEYIIEDDFILQHIRALRLCLNDTCSLFNGINNQEWHADIIDVNKKSAKLYINSLHTINRELNKSINLIQALINPNKLELIIEKTTELGIDNIYLIPAAYSNTNLTIENKDKKLNRLSKIIIAACEQCGRNTLPSIHNLNSWKNCLDMLQSMPQDRLKFFLTTDIANSIDINKKNIKNICDINVKNYNSIYYIIGPEGGFSPTEQKNLFDAECIGVNLCSTILKSETASIAVLSYLNFS